MEPPEKGVFSLQASSSKRRDACRCYFLRAAKPRCSCYTICLCFYYPLPLCPSCRSTPNHRLSRYSSMRRAQQTAFGKQSAAEQTSLAPHDSKARLRVVTNRRDSWRSHVHRTRLRSVCSSSSCKPAMCGVKGQCPLRSLGGSRGPVSHVREWPPFPHSLRRAGNPIAAFRQQESVKRYCFNSLLISFSASAVPPSKSTQG